VDAVVTVAIVAGGTGKITTTPTEVVGDKPYQKGSANADPFFYLGRVSEVGDCKKGQECDSPAL
jgi:hypothetical protein